MENKDQELTAVLMDRYLLPFGRHVNPSVPTEKLKQTIEEMELTLKDLAPSEKNDEVKKIWLILPRGSISDYESYEELIECEEVHNYDEYIQRWEQEYPDQPTWYELTFVKTDTYCGLFINNKHIVSLVLDKGTVDINYTLEAAESFFPLLVGAAAKSMEMLKKGEYNAFVEKNLPYYYRTGVIKRSDEWKGDPGAKERIFEGLSEETYKEFRQYIENGENYQNQIGRLKEMTGNDFLRACSVGYKACGYKGTDLPLVDQYMMHADGRDDGLTGKGHTLNRSKGIDLDDPKAWDEWIANKDRNIGHPWEVCRGGNSTHISLFVWHDSFEIDHFERTGRLTHEEAEEARKNSGYYFELEGTAWTRACETVNFFVALRKAGYPVLLLDADPILSRFKGEDLIGIVPRPVTPAYCESMFPASLGRILDFMNVYDEDMELFGDSIEWLPITPAKLL